MTEITTAGTAPQSRRAAVRGLAAILTVCLTTLTAAAAPAGVMAQDRTPSRGLPLPAAAAPPQSQATLLQRLRELIGYNPRQAIGGSRSGGARSMCLITPRFQQSADGQAKAVVSLPTPTLVAAGLLNEVRLEKEGRILWGKRASSLEPITGPIAWPLPPLQPGETVQLRLRPQGAAGADFATITLQAATAGEQQRALQLLASERPRLELVEAQALQGRAALGSELLFAPLEQPTGAIKSLRRALIEQGCGITPAAP